MAFGTAAGKARHDWGAGVKQIDTLVVALLSLGAGVLALRLWRAHLSLPFEYGPDDSEYQLMLVKGVLSTGWWFTNPHLGAPFGQQLYDFSVGGDNLQLLVVRALGLFSSNVAVVTNLFFLISFPLGGAAAYVAARWAGCSRAASGTVAILFSILPYAFLRGEHHAFLEADYAVPLGAALALAVLERRPLFGTRRRRALTIAVCVACGATGTFYYGTFTAALLLVAGVAAYFRDGRRAAIAPAACIAVIAAVFVLDLAPTLVYRIAHGTDHAVATRPASDSDLYGLKLAQLVLPVPGERIGPLARLTNRYDTTTFPAPPNESFSSPLGLVGTVGFAALLIAVLAAAARAAVRVAPGLERGRSLTDQLAAPGLLALVAFLIGTVGGLGTVFAYTVTSALRGWDRIAPFIAFLSLLAVARLLDVARGPLSRRFNSRAVVALPVIVLLVGVLDQTPATFVPPYAASAARWRGDASFVARIDAIMPAGAMVFQLPYEPFPEGQPIGAMGGYDPLRGYLHDDRLRWSFGAMRGRAADWAAQLAMQPLSVRLPAVAAAGFDGMWLDTAGIAAPPSAVIKTYSRALGTEPTTDANGALAFFDLRPYAARLRAAVGAAALTRARRAVLYPLTIGDPSAGPPPPLQLASAPQKLTLINPRSATAAAELTIYATGAAPGTLTLRGSGFVSSAPLSPATAGVEVARLAIRLTPGTTRLQISSTTGARAAVAVITDRSLLGL